MKNFSDVGWYLRQHRRAAKVTQKQVAEVLGYSNAQFVSNIERGLANLPSTKVPQIAKLLNVDAGELFGLVVAATVPPIKCVNQILLHLNKQKIYVVDGDAIRAVKESAKLNETKKTETPSTPLIA